ncbi:MULTISPECIES: cytosine permease [Streptomycetaceae]|uniref:Transmembrane transport protein n=1 Tax=Streptantibioticus cattleyicolor (strain ATCC 35852 / DSM 46488 / JCM 4925 / NBRC 14057 / NRRL 8057) TaxID=1003195 RepID=F8JSJ0_STREN|nr:MULTISPECIES: cytosine permease [Streptomycetaceae]AEW96715.1 transmembrane transport protein [Streptantibioticus cattleyicolor NRRL 8057 = DSM 46488]MYS61203.1 cytosine permease [Streptomyces sp. SID5468]CCB77052.1 putative transmembrane transport protein [Streptantibioticus cattleyicolor NRRL 8057 = DSM 46488]
MEIEQRGVDTVPEAERTSGPRDVVAILLGSNLALGVIVFGWLPVSFGLGWWGSLTSLAAGTVVGVVLVAPLALVSLRSATNLSTSSGAHFGVRGRLLGSLIGLLLSLGYTALTLWVGGDAVVGCLHRMLGLPAGAATYAVVYAVLAATTATSAVFGYRMLLRLSNILAVGLTVLLLAGVLAYAGAFHTSPAHGSHYLLGGFRPTWLLSAVSAGLSGPMAFITLLGDYTRYVSPTRHRPRAVFLGTCFGLVVGLLVPQLFGTFTALAVDAAGPDYAGPLVAACPAWYLVLLLVNASAGSVGNAGLMLYSMGLDLDAILPKATRTQATYVVAAVSTVLVFLGHFAWAAQDAMTSFVLVLTAVGTPWAVITLLGFARVRGRYDPESLQVYNRRTVGGIYWYTAGWNLQATVAWAAGSAVGLMAVDTPLYSGPLLRYTGGIDVSFLIAAAVTAGCYLALDARRPHPLPRETEEDAAVTGQGPAVTV